ncbi:phosphoribosyltransferase family protein [Anaerolineales bacterium]
MPPSFSKNQLILTWQQVDKLLDTLTPQINAFGAFNAMVMITRGGLVPGGMLAEALDIQHVLTAAVDFPATQNSAVMSWPKFLQFPDASLLIGRKTLIVDDVWGSGKTSSSVKKRAMASGATALTCVLHYNPYRSLFGDETPDFYGDVTDAYVTYPWEIDRGLRGYRMTEPQGNI